MWQSSNTEIIKLNNYVPNTHCIVCYGHCPLFVFILLHAKLYKKKAFAVQALPTGSIKRYNSQNVKLSSETLYEAASQSLG